MIGKEFDLNDFRQQIRMKRMDTAKDIMRKFLGMGDWAIMDVDGGLKRIQGIIDSMTAAERLNPRLIDKSRRRRIAAGSRVDPSAVACLVKQYVSMAEMVRRLRRKDF